MNGYASVTESGSFFPGSTSSGEHEAYFNVFIEGKQLTHSIEHEKKVAYSVVTDKAEKNFDKIEAVGRDKLKVAIAELLGQKRVLSDKQEKALQLMQKSLSSGKAVNLAEAG